MSSHINMRRGGWVLGLGLSVVLGGWAMADDAWAGRYDDGYSYRGYDGYRHGHHRGYLKARPYGYGYRYGGYGYGGVGYCGPRYSTPPYVVTRDTFFVSSIPRVDDPNVRF